MRHPHYAVVWQTVAYDEAHPEAKLRCGHCHDTTVAAHACAAALFGRHQGAGDLIVTGIYRIVHVSRTGRVELVGTAPAPSARRPYTVLDGGAA